MDAEPLVSVIMPVYNGAKYVKDAIESILIQTFRNFEFIIIDDGSTDGTHTILMEYADTDDRLIVRRQRNLGVIASLNSGCRLAKGKYIARMDADDVSLSKRFARQVNYLETHPEIGILGTWVEYIDKEGRTQGYWRTPEQPVFVGWSLLFGTCLAHPTIMMRKGVLEQLGYYSLEALYVEDYELWIRASTNVQLANFPEVLLQRRIWEENVSHKHWKTQEKNLVKVMRTSVSSLLDSSVSTESIQCLRRLAVGPPLHRYHDIKKTARLIRRLYRSYLEANCVARLEAKAVGQDAARKICKLAAWASKVSLCKGLFVCADALAFDPASAVLHMLKMGNKTFWEK